MEQDSKAREPATRCRPDRLAWLGILVLTLAGFALYVWTLDRQGLWFDEGLSVVFASRPLPQLLHTLVYEDLHPPLYYFLLHFWMILAGASEWAVRLPSVFAAVLLLPLAFAIVREVLGGDRARAGAWIPIGFAAAALIGTSPFIAFYAQETRMYSLAASLALATTWALLRATRTDCRRSWLLFACLLAASFYTQYFSAFLVPAFWLYAFVFDRRYARHTVLATALAGLLYLPWIGPAYLQIGRLLRTPDYWATTKISLGQFVRAMWNTFLPNATMRWVLPVALLGLVMIIRWVRHSKLRLSLRLQRGVLVFLTFVVPLALTYVAVTFAPKFVTRYAIVAAAPLYVCIALALDALLGHKSILTRLLFAAVVIFASLTSLRSALAVTAGRENRRDDARALAAYLSENSQPNDALLLAENAPYALQYYYRGATPIYGLHVGQDFAGAANVLNAILQTRPRRIWLVLWHYEFADPTDMLASELLRVGREVNIERQFWGYDLRAFDVQDNGATIVAAPQPAVKLGAEFAPALRLVGFDRFERQDGRLHYLFYWQTRKPFLHNYRLVLTLRDADGNEYLHLNEALSTDYFLPRVWPLDVLIRGRVDVALPADLPAIAYRAYLSVFDPEAQRNVDLVDANGTPQGQALLLENIVLSKLMLDQSPTLVANRVEVDLGSGLRLLGFDLPTTDYGAGDMLQLTLWWQRVGTGEQDAVRFCLVDSTNSIVWQAQAPVLSGYPLATWQVGEVNRALYRLPLPSHLASGTYSLQAGSGDRLAPLAHLEMAAREHRYDVPPMQSMLSLPFEQGITLLGYDLQAPEVRPGSTITITLYWRTQQRITDSYKVSVQVLSTDRRITAQDDGIPVRWSYPTTAWLPGEVIADEHSLSIQADVAAGSYTIIAALYDERNAQRLQLEQGGLARDHAVLTVLTLSP